MFNFKKADTKILQEIPKIKISKWSHRNYSISKHENFEGAKIWR